MTVAVVDTGVDASHPDLAGRVAEGAIFLDQPLSLGPGTRDGNGHGTHVAGIIAAVANNGIGVAGLADGATILPVQVLDSVGSGWNSDVARGVIWAADHGAQVINMSLGGTDDDPVLAAAVAYAQSKDVVVVAAAGNAGHVCDGVGYTPEAGNCGNPLTYPAGYPGVVAVSATDVHDVLAPFSETGPQVSLAAPGVDIGSTYPEGTYPFALYVLMDGTSMASPFVAASAALVRAAAPDLTAPQVVTALTSTAVDLGAPGRDDAFGHGLVDPLAAVRSVLPGAAEPTSTGPSSTTGTPEPTTSGPTTTPEPTTPTPTSTTPTPTSTTPTPAPTTVAPAATTTTLTLSASRVRSGAAVTATLSVRTGAGSALSGTAQICATPVGTTASRCSSVAVVGGRATTVLRPQVGVTVTGRYLGAAAWLGSSAAPRGVQVGPTVTVGGGSRALSAAVSLAQGQRVAVQRYRSGRWTTVRLVTVTSSARWTARGLAPGTYRLAVPATRQLLAATSAQVRVR